MSGSRKRRESRSPWPRGRRRAVHQAVQRDPGHRRASPRAGVCARRAEFASSGTDEDRRRDVMQGACTLEAKGAKDDRVLIVLMTQLALAQTAEVRSPVAVVLASQRPGAETVAPQIVQWVLESFKREGVSGLLDDAATKRELAMLGSSAELRSCEGLRTCLSKLGFLLGPKAVVVGVDVGRFGKTLAIHLEAIAADSGDRLGTLHVSSLVDDWREAMTASMGPFVRDVKVSLEVAKEAAPTTVLSPPSSSMAAVAETPQATSGLRIAAYVSGAAGLLAGGVALFAGLRANDANSRINALCGTGSGCPVGTSGVEELRGTRDTNTAVATTSGVIGTAALAASVVMFVLSAQAKEPVKVADMTLEQTVSGFQVRF